MDIGDLDPDPIQQFQRWFAGVEDHAVSLATATSDGVPSVRVVLHKSADERGFVFFTNYQSRKAAELTDNPRAALAFHWSPDRQVRVEGVVERVSVEESDAYWQTRPRGSQLGAWASAQSTEIADRAALEQRLAEVVRRFGDGEVPRPAHWGGYRVVPHRIEFWRHRDDRLHDRIEYRRDASDPASAWTKRRLSP